MSYLLRRCQVVDLSPRASLNDAMKRGTMRSRTTSGAFCATNDPAAAAASSAAGRSASRAASQPPEAIEPNAPPPRLESVLPPFRERAPFESSPPPERTLRATIAAAPAANAAAAAAFIDEAPPCVPLCDVISAISSGNLFSSLVFYELDFALAPLEDPDDDLPPPRSSPIR